MEIGTYLVSSDTGAKHWSNAFRIDVLRQYREILGVQYAVFLEAAVSVMQVILCLGTMLFSIVCAVLALMANASNEANSYQGTDLHAGTCGLGTQSKNLADTFMSAHMRQLDVRYGASIRTGCGASLCMQIC